MMGSLSHGMQLVGNVCGIPQKLRFQTLSMTDSPGVASQLLKHLLSPPFHLHIVAQVAPLLELQLLRLHPRSSLAHFYSVCLSGPRERGFPGEVKPAHLHAPEALMLASAHTCALRES